ncbi:F-box and WD-40 domain protein 10 [Schistosoma bovis]|uniref:F-box and WD-40 domain protein 10 n=1 Tax=Schistosoma bovis TaxID=6184 RepID=A0A430Q230_SCHBO|nr:F-box and WD-40 domain protein 10 [Schistosoma bovis]
MDSCNNKDFYNCCSCATCIFSELIKIGECILSSWCTDNIKDLLMSLMSNPYLNKLRDDICKLVELNKSKDILYSKMRLYGCMDWNLASDKRKLLSPQHMDEVETRVINYLSLLPLVYQRLFILYVLVGSSPSMTSSISSELHKNSLQKGDFKTREYESSIQLPWNITSKIKSFVNNQEKKAAHKTTGSPSTELQCTSSLFRVDPHFMRYTLVPVPVCPIQLRSKISGEPNSGLFKEPRVVTGSNDNTCSQGKKMHSDSFDDWNDLIQKSWDSISYEMKQAYNKIKIRYALMFERNIYCGPFSIYVLLERQPNQPLCKRRVIHVDNRSHWLAHCEGRSQQRTIKFIDITMKSFCEKSSSNCIHKQNVWRLDEQKPLWIMKHSTPITSVGLRGYICTTGEHSGRINVWRIGNKKPILIKVLTGHTDVITALRFDNYHLVTSSRDKSVKIWSIIGEFSDCIGTLVHTGEVLCVELIDLRIITGCSDGRIRVWNLLTQHCQRILPGNYRHDPIISIMPLENRYIFSLC